MPRLNALLLILGKPNNCFTKNLVLYDGQNFFSEVGAVYFIYMSVVLERVKSWVTPYIMVFFSCKKFGNGEHDVYVFESPWHVLVNVTIAWGYMYMSAQHFAR